MTSGPEDAVSLGVQLTNLDEPLFDGAGATKRDLINYLDGVADRMILELADRPLSVIRGVSPGVGSRRQPRSHDSHGARP